MPRRTRADKIHDLELLATHHLVDVRYSRGGREIVAVKHLAYGWISPKAFYVLDEVHAAMPKILEGGYRLKEALWQVDLTISGQILATGVETEIPVAGLIIGGALALAAVDAALGNWPLALLDVAAIALPYGEIYLILRGAWLFAGVNDAIKAAVRAKLEEAGVDPARIEDIARDPIGSIVRIFTEEIPRELEELVEAGEKTGEKIRDRPIVPPRQIR